MAYYITMSHWCFLLYLTPILEINEGPKLSFNATNYLAKVYF